MSSAQANDAVVSNTRVPAVASNPPRGQSPQLPHSHLQSRGCSMAIVASDIQVTGRIHGRQDQILTQHALGFLAELQRRFQLRALLVRLCRKRLLEISESRGVIAALSC